ncbi:MAG: GspE/PulE family protein [Verrucomicrobia bacterium]|nr:GspE/PulE family protein [Verrucomicrobiota bacterium]MBU4291094.1 GspE/PulE family protein [Verrucomicrobiota bacterium]MBU4429356.1 GspE/PulE family protein [Verrucomicrobiota bacterium]MBU4498131.1 GspE/PulE family protein [Verrucomicrobiota bacterium]MCG2680111.1 GspE/PulE family protein [Kiritimatiellia bacterium]
MNQDLSQQMLAQTNEDLAKRLMAKGLLTSETLKKAMAVSRETRELLVEVLVNLDLLSKQTAYEELAGIFGVPFVDLETYIYNQAVVSLIDEKLARELEVFPLFAIGDSLTVALADPSDITVLDRLATALGKFTIEPCLAARKDIHEMINRVYSGHEEFKELLDQMGEDSLQGTMAVKSQESILQSSKSPVSRLVDMIVAQAVRDRASDIHIDPGEGQLKVRFRIDGVLYDIPPPPKYLHPFIISRIKVISSMDIAESRIPQDGHFQITIDKRTVEARVSSMPTTNGENMAIRLFDTRAMAIPLESMGISDRLLPQVERMIRRPYGMVVVTGPTGSGKSTTLYAMLSKAKSPERNIITIEDPVERRMDLVTQIQVNEKAGLTFASALRSILRQDPDVIMVGEVRDPETAQLSVRAALTGHLVFSTIHTNDAPGAVTRLINMNIEAFLVSSSLVGAMAQRLVRRICEECREPFAVPDGLRQRLTASGLSLPGKMWRGKGCSKCRDTGYVGRIAVFELMPVTLDLADIIAAGQTTAALRAQARKDGMVSMLDDGIEKVERGITTLEEVLRTAALENVAEISLPPGSLPKEQPEAGEAEPAMEAVKAESLSLDLDDYRKQMTSWLAKKNR